VKLPVTLTNKLLQDEIKKNKKEWLRFFLIISDMGSFKGSVSYLKNIQQELNLAILEIEGRENFNK
jgi:hypothetical protein